MLVQMLMIFIVMLTSPSVVSNKTEKISYIQSNILWLIHSSILFIIFVCTFSFSFFS